MRPDPQHITLDNNIPRIKEMLISLVLRPRRDLIRWAEITKQTPNIRLGYPGQHLASLVTGVKGERTGARGHDLSDGSEVKSCSRVDQLDKCKECKAAVARIEKICPQCGSQKVTRNNDSKWLIGIKNKNELAFLLDEVPRIVFIISDYPNFDSNDWETLRFQVFEIWPAGKRHKNFRSLMSNYFYNIYLPHPTRTPAPKNIWPDSFQFFMCNPIRTLHCIVKNSLKIPIFDEVEYVKPYVDRSKIIPVPMPTSILYKDEESYLRKKIGNKSYDNAEIEGLTEDHRMLLKLRDTSHANPQVQSYRRGTR